jgi:hypothetical protein
MIWRIARKTGLAGWIAAATDPERVPFSSMFSRSSFAESALRIASSYEMSPPL